MLDKFMKTVSVTVMGKDVMGLAQDHLMKQNALHACDIPQDK
jgi:hypothetical protein